MCLRKPPPKPAFNKRPADDGSSTPSTGTPAPSTPAQSESGEPKRKAARKTQRAAEEQIPLTPIQKAKDMLTKVLKKKNDASNLTLSLQSLPYAEALSNEMKKFADRFEFFG